MNAFKEFERNYSYEYLAQPDSGDKSVIFKFYPKNQYRRLPKEKWVEPIVFESLNLNIAFDCAFLLTTNAYTFEQLENYGVIKPFDHEVWNKQTYPETFYSVGDKCWKNLADVLAKEDAERQVLILKKK